MRTTYITFIAVAVLASSTHALKCYFGSSGDVNNPDLPANAELLECNNPVGICYKAFTVMKNLNTSETILDFVWGCTDTLNTLNKFIKCGSNFEDSYGSIIDGDEMSYYSRLCTCCEEGCNDATMNDKCNQVPLFAKSCYTAGRSQLVAITPKLPKNAFNINCTASQSCYKSSKLSGSATSYIWGCASTLGRDCGISVNFTDESNDYYKVCTCCGDDCNDARMDSVLANSTTCNSEVSTTVKPVTVTFHVPTTVNTSPVTLVPPVTPEPSNDAAVVGGVLGAFLFVAILIILYLLHVIKKMKHPDGEAQGLMNMSSKKNNADNL